MRTSLYVLSAILLLPFTGMAQTMGAMTEEELKHEHGAEIFHAFKLEVDTGLHGGEHISSWDLDGWIGTDENKLVIKTEGNYDEHALQQDEVWALYSRNIAEFWDAQIGLRFNFEPHSTTYLALGFGGTAPYNIDTEAHLFLSEEGDVLARFKGEYDLPLTQQLIAEPYAELNLALQNIPKQDVGSGVSEAEFGVQTRYEITRQFAPYVDVSYSREFGNTASISRAEGESEHEFVGKIGLRLLF